MFKICLTRFSNFLGVGLNDAKLKDLKAKLPLPTLLKNPSYGDLENSGDVIIYNYCCNHVHIIILASGYLVAEENKCLEDGTIIRRRSIFHIHKFRFEYEFVDGTEEVVPEKDMDKMKLLGTLYVMSFIKLSDNLQKSIDYHTRFHINSLEQDWNPELHTSVDKIEERFVKRKERKITKMRRKAVKKAISQLSPKQMEMAKILIKNGEKKTQNELAEQMQTNRTNIEDRIHGIKRKLANNGIFEIKGKIYIVYRKK